MQIVNKFTFREVEFDIYNSMEQPYFRAKDVGKAIGYSRENIRHMCDLVEPNHKILSGTQDTDQVKTWGGSRRSEYFLTEEGLYDVLCQSKMPLAREFRKVVTTHLKAMRIRQGGSFQIFDEMPDDSFYGADGKLYFTKTVPGGDVMIVDEYGNEVESVMTA